MTTTLALDDPTSWPAIALATCCFALATIGAHAGAALLVYSPTKLARSERMRSGGPEPATARHLDQHAHQYAVVAWTLAIGGVAGLFPLLAAAVTPGWPLQLAAALIVPFACVALPIALSASRAEQIVLLTLPVLRVACALLRYPLLAPLLALTHGTLRALRIPEEPRTPEEIADEIAAAVTDSAAENQLAEEQRNWIENIVELKEMRVSEAMTPRTDVVALEAGMNLHEAAQRAIETGHSRYPVYEEEVDRIVGVFYAKDALAQLSNASDKQLVVRDIMRKPLFVPESMGVSELLRQFKGEKLQLAIVLDEYGGTAGLISIEDILEEIVGDISDEFDVEEEAPIKVIAEDRIVELSGRARVDEVNAILGCEIDENPEYDTVAGFVFTRLGKIPETGDTLQFDGIEIEILDSDDRRINRMRLTLPEPLASKGEA